MAEESLTVENLQTKYEIEYCWKKNKKNPK